MKKIIFIFLFILMVILPIDIYGKEMVVPELGHDDYSCVDYLDKRNTFNYLECQYNDYVEERINAFNEVLSKNNSYHGMANAMHFYIPLRMYSKEGEHIGYVEIHITYEIIENKIKKVLVDVDGVNKINFYIYEFGADPSRNYIDFVEYNENIKLVTYNGYSCSSDYKIDDIFSIKPDIFIVMLYEYEESSDVYVPTFSDLTAEEIIDEIGLVDSFNDRLVDIFIISCNYYSNSNYGDYKIKIRAYNNEKQVIFKWIYVHVSDLDSIVKASNFMTSCNNKIDDLEIIDGLDIGVDYESVTIRSDYHHCSNKKGRYKYLANIRLSNMNVLITGTIDVTDNEKPYGVVVPELITVSNDKCLSKEDILKKFVIYDDQDGYIPSSNISLNGLISYLSSYTSLIDHDITLVARDDSNNTFEHKFILRVTDDKSYIELERFTIPEYIEHVSEPGVAEEIPENNVIEEAKEEIYNPVISNSNYVIRAYTTHKLTASEVQDLLISDGYLNNYDVVSIDSEYFKEANPKAGSFSLSVTYQNGDVTYYEINLVEKEEIKEEEKSYTGLIVSIIIGSVVLVAVIIIVIMRVYVHVKKN